MNNLHQLKSHNQVHPEGEEGPQQGELQVQQQGPEQQEAGQVKLPPYQDHKLALDQGAPAQHQEDHLGQQ